MERKAYYLTTGPAWLRGRGGFEAETVRTAFDALAYHLSDAPRSIAAGEISRDEAMRALADLAEDLAHAAKHLARAVRA